MKTESLAQCSSYFSPIMFGSIWNRSSKNYKIPKKKETITLRCSLMRKKNNFRGFWVFDFGIYPKSKTQKSQKVLFTWIFGSIWNSKSKDWPERKNCNFTMWFEKKKCPFPRFASLRFCPILETENLETSESFGLLQFFIVLVALRMRKMKTFHWISN